MAFHNRLKERREYLGLSRNEVAKKLGVTASAVGNYENGVSSPKEEILYKIFDALRVDPNYLWQDEIKDTEVPFVCSYPEQHLIKKYRNLDDYGKKAVKAILDIEAARMEREASLLNEDKLQIDLFDLPASAGFGLPMEGEYRTIIEVSDTPLNRKADFCIRVAGNSMEPDFSDGEIVLVKKETVAKGDIGIFVLNGESYIKELGENILISHNKNYSNISLSENDSLFVAGKVIGKI